MRSSTSATLSLAAAVFLAMCAAAPMPAAGDVVVLQDDTRIAGTIARADEGFEVTTEDGNVVFVRFADVKRIIAGDAPTRPTSQPASDAEDAGVAEADEADDDVSRDLASLRRSVANIDNLDRIVRRYEQFVQSHPADAEAAEDLKTWQQRQANGDVKFRDRWMPIDERDDLVASVFELANFIRLAINAGDLETARESLDDLEQLDPSGPSAPYFRGVLAQQDDRQSDARTAFQTVRRLLPNHAPTLINLAALDAGAQRPARAAVFLGEAMRANPLNRSVLDASAEAFAMIQDGVQPVVVRRAHAMFVEQDTQLTKQLRGEGLYRWGSAWLTADDWQVIADARAAVEDDLQVLRNDFRGAETRQRAIATQIERNQNLMSDLVRSTYYRDTNGEVRQGPLPANYFTLQRENQSLEDESRLLEVEKQRLSTQAAGIEANLPQPTYNGRIQPVGADGVPVDLPASQARPEIRE